jgi:hypothetical protein
MYLKKERQPYFNVQQHANFATMRLKIKFDPSLDRSCCEFFKIIKDRGPNHATSSKVCKYFFQCLFLVFFPAISNFKLDLRYVING